MYNAIIVRIEKSCQTADAGEEEVAGMAEGGEETEVVVAVEITVAVAAGEVVAAATPGAVGEGVGGAAAAEASEEPKRMPDSGMYHASTSETNNFT